MDSANSTLSSPFCVRGLRSARFAITPVRPRVRVGLGSEAERSFRHSSIVAGFVPSPPARVVLTYRLPIRLSLSAKGSSSPICFRGPTIIAVVEGLGPEGSKQKMADSEIADFQRAD